MKRLAALVLIAALVACGGDSGPSNVLSGTWTGSTPVTSSDTLYFSFTSAQSGSAVSGSGLAWSGTDTTVFSFTGTSVSPAVNLQIAAGGQSLTYAGTFVKSDSVAGTVSEGGTSLALDLKKH